MMVDAKCPNCGAALKVDPSHTEAWCHACDSTFLLTQEVINYNTYQTVNNNVQNVYGAKSPMEELLKREQVFLRISDMNKLSQLYDEMTGEHPERYEGWWGLMYCRTDRFQNPNVPQDDLEKWFGLVRNYAPPQKLPELEQTYAAYQKRVVEFRIQNLENQKNNWQQQITSAKQNMQNQNNYYKNGRRKEIKQNLQWLAKPVSKIRVYTFLILIVLGFVTLVMGNSDMALVCFFFAFILPFIVVLFTPAYWAYSKEKKKLNERPDHSADNNRIQSAKLEMQKLDEEIARLQSQL